MNQNLRLSLLFVVSLALTSCWWDDSPTAPERAPRNTFADYQHISGYVNGVWTKEHNPHMITGETYIKEGDSLVIQDGVEIVASATINVDEGVLKMNGSSSAPIRFTQVSSLGGGIFVYSGDVKIRYVIFEGHAKSVSVGCNSEIEHAVFSEAILAINSCATGSALVVRNSIFAGYRPWDSPLGGAQFRSWYDAFLDSSKTDVRNNLFFTGIGDSTWAMDPPPVVDVLLKGKSGTKRVQAIKWPGNGNIFANPKWVKYNYVGPSPVGISDNDYHLQPGSAAIGAASDGTNIGAY